MTDIKEVHQTTSYYRLIVDITTHY